jgi:hypothetical protein
MEYQYLCNEIEIPYPALNDSLVSLHFITQQPISISATHNPQLASKISNSLHSQGSVRPVSIHKQHNARKAAAIMTIKDIHRA